MMRDGGSLQLILCTVASEYNESRSIVASAIVVKFLGKSTSR